MRTLLIAMLAMAFCVVPNISLRAAEEESAVAPIMKLIKSGKVPPARVGNFVDAICQRGNASDLAYIFEQATAPTGYTGDLLRQALAGLVEASRSRNVMPKGDLSPLVKLLSATTDIKTRALAVELAGLWKLKSAAPELQTIALEAKAEIATRRTALAALTGIGGEELKATAEKLAEKSNPPEIRLLAIAALVRGDLPRAAELAAALLAEGGTYADLTPLVVPFLDDKNGPAKLADAVTKTPPKADLAKLALRAIYAFGRSDAVLVGPLSKAAGIEAEVKLPTKEEMDVLIADVAKHGSAARGEQIFRRKDLSCVKCHSVSKAGGDIGPDLSSVGALSPVDYLIKSIYAPSEAIKEAFVTKQIITGDGLVFKGIVADRNSDRIILKEATGEQRTIRIEDIDEEKDGGSLMPEGLTKFLTREELVDLLRFLSELGKPGEYAVRSVPSMQRWRVLDKVPEALAKEIPLEDAVQKHLVEASEANWLPAYAKAAGMLPLDEIVSDWGKQVIYLKGEIDVTADGPVDLQVNSPDGLTAWLDQRPIGVGEKTSIELTSGRRAIFIRIDTAARKQHELKLELGKPEDSTAEFTPVLGK